MVDIIDEGDVSESRCKCGESRLSKEECLDSLKNAQGVDDSLDKEGIFHDTEIVDN